VPQKHSGYLVTRASIYTVHPVITDDRAEVVEEATPSSEELGPFGKFMCWVIGLPLGLWLGHWIVGLWCHCYKARGCTGRHGRCSARAGGLHGFCADIQRYTCGTCSAATGLDLSERRLLRIAAKLFPARA
jgi:hypothetical protein